MAFDPVITPLGVWYRAEIRENIDISAPMAHDDGPQFVIELIWIVVWRPFVHGDHCCLRTPWQIDCHQGYASGLGLPLNLRCIDIELMESPFPFGARLHPGVPL